MQQNGHSVLLEDSNSQIGQKFAIADLVGIASQIIIGPRNLANNTIEIKDRRSGLKQELSVDNFFASLKN